MIQGVTKVVPDHRDLSHTRTFGATTPSTFPDEFNTDSGLTNPNQNAEGLPNGCTGYTQSELCIDQDKLIYKAKFTYDKTCFMEGHGEESGCDIRNSLKSLLVYGPQEQGESTDQQALQHIRGAYYAIEKAPDYFDGIRSALVRSGSVSVGTPWFPSFNKINNGIVGTPVSWDATNLPYHNWKICGWKTVNGSPYLVGKAWLGSLWAQNGFALFPREVINQLLELNWTGAFAVDKYDPKAKTIVLESMYEVLLSYLYRILGILKNNHGTIMGSIGRLVGKLGSAASV